MNHPVSQRIPVELDFLEANAIIAALEQRLQALRGHIEHGVDDAILDAAIVHTLRAETQLRRAFRIPTEEMLDAQHEAVLAEMDELADAEFVVTDIPLALLTYMAEGR